MKVWSFVSRVWLVISIKWDQAHSVKIDIGKPVYMEDKKEVEDTKETVETKEAEKENEE